LLGDFEEPCSIPEAFTRRRILIGEIQEIQAQLGDWTKREKVRHNRRAYQDYAHWRTSAVWAMTSRLEELRYIKSWIFERQTFEEDRVSA
jgi:hypothetical protein